MTTLKELFMSRACKVGLAVMLAASMVPVAALSTSPAFAEEAEAERAAVETATDERATYLAEPDEDAAAAGADDAEAPVSDEAPEGEDAPTTDAVNAEQPAGEPIEGEGTANTGESIDGTSEAVEDEEQLSVSDLQIDSLETTVQEPFSFWTPFRLFFGASSDTFTVPLKVGNYTNWIDRLDLSGAIGSNGTNYALNFYDILVEGADNDGTKDVLIENKSFAPAAATILSTTSPASRATIGNIYRVNGTSGILAAIVDDPEAATASDSLTDVEQHVRRYINETYGAFDRDYPSSFWRDVNFGTMFVRDKKLNQTMCFFAMKNDTFDLRAEGYRSQASIKAAIQTLDENAAAISAAFEASGADTGSDYERVRFYNQWICDNNSYNSRFNGLSGDALKQFQSENPDVWSAMSAISGRTGETGPVCEGYSRAMQLLCQKAGIGCVVVDGETHAGPHMWNYVRIGSNWYGLDITWNDSGDNEQYLLVGSDTGFLDSHPIGNQFVANGTKFTNGPVLSAASYDPRNVSFAGAITTSDTFPYGDAVTLDYNSTTKGDIAYTLVEGADIAEIVETTTPAESATNGGRATLKITGTGDITVKATLTPTDGNTELTDTITITAVPRPLKVTGTELASKVYDGTVDARVRTAGRLDGVLESDATKLELNATSARYNDVNAGTNLPGSATYDLTGDADVLKLYTLEGDGIDTSATGTISKRPVTAYFGLTSTRVLTTEELPSATVRFETAGNDRGKLEEDDLAPENLTIQTKGMPASMPTDLASGASRTYEVTWTSQSNVLAEIEKMPAAANYDVAVSSDAEQNTVTLTIVNLADTSVLDGASPSGSATYRVEARINGINDDTIAKLTEADAGYTSLDSIVKKLLESISDQATKELSDDRVIVYDMTLFVQNDKGEWEPATTDTFPTDGVRVTVDYPKNTAGNTHSFYAAHMFTSEVTSGGTVHKPGEVEAPQVMNGVDGPNFVLMGFSPVTLAWEDMPQTSQAGGGQGQGITTQTGQNAQKTGASNVSQTGDSLPVLGITVIALACIVLIVALVVRRNRDKKSGDKS